APRIAADVPTGNRGGRVFYWRVCSGCRTGRRGGRGSKQPRYPGAEEIGPTPPPSLAPVPTHHAPRGVGDYHDSNLARCPLLTPIIPEAPPVPLVIALVKVDGVGFQPRNQAQLHGIIIRPAEEAAQLRSRHADLNPLEICPCDGLARPRHEDHRDHG